MRTALLALLLCTGCQTAVAIDRPDIVAALAVRYGAACVRSPAPPPGPAPTPTPTPTPGSCAPGCTCGGTGREKTGDGLSTVDCRCDASCSCKPREPEPAPQPKPQPAAPVEPPPLRRIEQPRRVYVSPPVYMPYGSSGSCR